MDYDAFAGNAPESVPMPETAVAGTNDNQSSDAEAAWRQEVASRVQQHRARRRRSVDPKALELDFSGDTPHSFGALASDSSLAPPPSRFAQILIDQRRVQEELARPEPKIIRFPRTQAAYIPTVEEVTLEELERNTPAPETPRILDAGEAEGYAANVAEQVFAGPIVEEQVFEEVTAEPVIMEQAFYASENFAPENFAPENFAPETFVPPVQQSYPVKMTALQGRQMDFLSSFEDIRLEADTVRHDDVAEIIPRPAPLMQRLISCGVDAGIVFTSTGVFALTFMIAAGEMPQSRFTLICMALAALIFWMCFQYTFLIFRRTTPGMDMAQLELCTFAGAKATLAEKQRRALASALSVCSAGLGYAWALVDEDRVAWHDRISGTHMRQAALSTQPSAFSQKNYFDWKHFLQWKSLLKWKHFLKSRSAARDPYEFDDLKG